MVTEGLTMVRRVSKRKKTSNVFAALILEVATLAGIVALAQPSWINSLSLLLPRRDTAVNDALVEPILPSAVPSELPRHVELQGAWQSVPTAGFGVVPAVPRRFAYPNFQTDDQWR